MIEITSIARNRKDGEGWVVEGHINMNSKKEFIAAEMSGILFELWHTDRNVFREAMDLFMEYTQNA